MVGHSLFALTSVIRGQVITARQSRQWTRMFLALDQF